MKIDISNAMNRGLIEYLRKVRDPNTPLIAAADSVEDPSSKQGSHPDVVGWLWGRIGDQLPIECQFLVCSTPALVHPRSGVVLGITLGTNYYLRFLPEHRQEVISFGGKIVEKQWALGGLNTRDPLLSDWINGGYNELEGYWCRALFDQLERGADAK
jgi:hypothetical protein